MGFGEFVPTPTGRTQGGVAMDRRRYTVQDEALGRWLIEDLAESAMGLETKAGARVTLTDHA